MRKIFLSLLVTMFCLGATPLRAAPFVLGDKAATEALAVVNRLWPEIKKEKNSQVRLDMLNTVAGICSQLGRAEESPWQPSDAEDKCLMRALSAHYWVLRGEWQKADGIMPACDGGAVLQMKVRLALEPLRGPNPAGADVVAPRLHRAWRELQKNKNALRTDGQCLALGMAVIGDRSTSRKWFDALEEEIGAFKPSSNDSDIDNKLILFGAEYSAGFYEQCKRIEKVNRWTGDDHWSRHISERDVTAGEKALTGKSADNWYEQFSFHQPREEGDWSKEWMHQTQNGIAFMCSVGERVLATLKPGEERDSKVTVVTQSWVRAGQPLRAIALAEKYLTGEALEGARLDAYEQSIFPEGWDVDLDGPTRAQWISRLAVGLRQRHQTSLETGLITSEAYERLVEVELMAGNFEEARRELWLVDKEIVAPAPKSSPDYDDYHEHMLLKQDLVLLAALWRKADRPQRAAQWLNRALKAPRYSEDKMGVLFASHGYWDAAGLFLKGPERAESEGPELMKLWKQRHGDSFPTWINTLPTASKLNLLFCWTSPYPDRATSFGSFFLFHLPVPKL